MTFGILAVRSLTEGAVLSGATNGATLSAGMAGVLFPLPFLDRLIGIRGADLSVGGAGLGAGSGAGAGAGRG